MRQWNRETIGSCSTTSFASLEPMRSASPSTVTVRETTSLPSRSIRSVSRGVGAERENFGVVGVVGSRLRSSRGIIAEVMLDHNARRPLDNLTSRSCRVCAAVSRRRDTFPAASTKCR